MLEYIVNKILERKHLQAVPKSWVTTFTDMAKTNYEMNRLMKVADESLNAVVEQYNELLTEYAKYAPLNKLKEDIESAGEKAPSSKDKAIEKFLSIYVVEMLPTSEEIKAQIDTKVSI
jgi:hypothetical protein